MPAGGLPASAAPATPTVRRPLNSQQSAQPFNSQHLTQVLTGLIIEANTAAHLGGADNAGLCDLGRRPHIQQHPALLHELCRVGGRHIAHLALCQLRKASQARESGADAIAISSAMLHAWHSASCNQGQMDAILRQSMLKLTGCVARLLRCCHRNLVTQWTAALSCSDSDRSRSRN